MLLILIIIVTTITIIIIVTNKYNNINKVILSIYYSRSNFKY